MEKRSKLPMLVVLYAAAFVSAFNESIVNVALVDVVGEFGVASTTAQWLVTDNPSFALSALLVVVGMMTTFSMGILLPLYFESSFAMSALAAGALILPAIGVNAVTAVFGGRVMDRRGPWPLLPVGFALISAGQVAIALTGESLVLLSTVAASVVVYAGVGLVFSPSQTAGLGTLPRREHPDGIAIMNTLIMVSASFGPSLFVGIVDKGATTAAGNGAAFELAQAAGFANAVMVAAVIAIVGLVVSLFVVENGRLVGTISRNDVMRYLMGVLAE